MDITAAIEYVDPPFWSADLAAAVIPRIVGGEDTVELAEQASELVVGLSDEDGSRTRFCILCCRQLPEGGLVGGAVLRGVWTSGKHGSLLTRQGLKQTTVFWWFAFASRQTLMSPAAHVD